MPAVIFDVGNVLIRWDARLLFRQLLPDEAAVEAFLAEIDFQGWNLGFDRGDDWDEGVATLSARHPQHAAPIAAFRDHWHETVSGAIDGSVSILADLAAPASRSMPSPTSRPRSGRRPSTGSRSSAPRSATSSSPAGRAC